MDRKIILEIEETVKEEIERYFNHMKYVMSHKIAMEIYRMILVNHKGCINDIRTPHIPRETPTSSPGLAQKEGV
jgi:hypothetical protein